ncbi:MAG: hypothetical protein MJE68_16480, partial [Proteobacteria bacterium]|nr:hypothetical protein [Pseudomonadota bacterium]
MDACDDDYLPVNIYEYVGEEKQEHSAATNINKESEEHEMKKTVSPQEIHQQSQINQISTDTHGFQKQHQEDSFKKTTRGIILTLLIILAVPVSISLVAIALSIRSYNVLDCRASLNTEKTNLSEIIFHFNVFKADVEYSLEQLKIDTNLAISQLTDNMSNFAVQIDNIQSVATTAVFNISLISIQLDVTNNSIASVATALERNISQLSTQLDATNSNITSVATTLEKNVSQLSTWLDTTNSSIISVATTIERNVSQLSTQLDATNSNIMSVATTVENNTASLDVLYRTFALSMQPACGTGLWYRVAHLNMTDPSQQCPSAWREYDTFRACGRPVSNGESSPSQKFRICHQYSKVCGRVIGIQFNGPDAFH